MGARLGGLLSGTHGERGTVREASALGRDESERVVVHNVKVTSLFSFFLILVDSVLCFSGFPSYSISSPFTLFLLPVGPHCLLAHQSLEKRASCT